MASFAVPFRPQSNAPPLVYDTPEWAAPPLYDYGFEILKGGVQVDKMSQLRKDKLVIGRLPLCDISLEHPSVSRYHAIVQFNQQGDGFIYDLNSAHGTFLNRTRLPARSHVSIKAGDQLIFGESTRICIFDTSKPISEADMAREEAIADRYRAQRKMAALRLAQKTQVHEQKEEDQGISWGFREDAEEEEEEEEEEDASGTASGDAALLNVNTEKMAFEDASKLYSLLTE
ncbi:SMAD/FHA domain-containing protein [Spinellus fusiger]|nr:SMAD/FHA domain-containing protein [Spinellus fusiger]